MKLGFAENIMSESFTLQPADQTPLGRSKMAGGSSFDRVGNLNLFRDMVDRFRTVEGQWIISLCFIIQVFRIGISFQFKPGIQAGCRRQVIRVNVVTASSETVVGIPVEV